jgi:hypothetical protein
VKPLRDAVVDINFDHAFSTQMQSSLSAITWLHLDAVRVMKEAAPKTIDQAITGSKDGAVIIAVTDYHLSNDGRQLFITANVDLYSNSASLAQFKPAKGKPDTPSASSNSLYRNTFTFESDVPGPPAKREANMVVWTANDGAAFRAAMKLGVTKLGDMIAMDIQGAPGDAGLGPQPDGLLTRNPDGSLIFVAG